MSLVLNESLVLAKTRSQDLKSVLKLNCWGSSITDCSLVRQLVNVEVIGLSCNEITTLEDFAYCRKLKELILRNNKIKNISEIVHLQGLPKLTTLWLGENPCAENTHNYRKVVLKALPNLTLLDNKPVTKEELQEIEELGNEIYEEVPYESSNSSGSGPSSAATLSNTSAKPHLIAEYEATTNELQNSAIQQETIYSNTVNADQYVNEASNYYQPNESTHDISSTNQYQFNDSQYNVLNKTAPISSRTSNTHHQQSRCLSSQGSVTALNGNQNQGWSSMSINNNNNNINNNILPKGGKSRSGNILSAVLCLVKELDYVSCEVVQTALHCRMEETSQ